MKVCRGKCRLSDGQVCCPESFCLYIASLSALYAWASGGFKTFMFSVTGYLVLFSPQTGSADMAQQVVYVKMIPTSWFLKGQGLNICQTQRVYGDGIQLYTPCAVKTINKG